MPEPSSVECGAELIIIIKNFLFLIMIIIDKQINAPYYYYWSGTKHLERMATALALTKQAQLGPQP